MTSEEILCQATNTRAVTASHVDALCALLGVDVRLEALGSGGRIIADLAVGLCFTTTPYIGSLDQHTSKPGGWFTFSGVGTAYRRRRKIG